MKRRNNRGIAAWLKWLLIIMVVGIVLAVGTCGIGGYLLYQKVKDSMSPEATKTMLGTMVSMRDLPPTYKYAMGMDMMVMKMAVIQDTGSKMTYTFMSVANNEKHQTAEQLVDEMSKGGIPDAGGGGSQGTRKMEVKSKGATKVGGIDMPYVIGVSEDKAGRRLPAFFGVVTPSPNSILMIIAVSETEGTDIDVNKVKEFLANIDSFKTSN